MNKKGKKILILVPGENARGGIMNYYKVLNGKFHLNVKYLYRGSRNWPNRKNIFEELIRIMQDYFSFLRLIKTREFGLIQTTTSFLKFSLIRYAIFLLIAKSHNLKVIVFFHGWDDTLADKIENSNLKLAIFKWAYFKSDAIIDLANRNVNRILKWGYSKPVYLETTAVDVELLKDINETFLIKKFVDHSECYNLLFLARVEIPKGIYEAIDAYKLLIDEGIKVSMTIAGDGTELRKVKTYISQNKINQINLKGYIQGDEKIETYKTADYYIFPSYFEGMPTSVLEAMAFGLPVITRSVGGLNDFFKNEINGFITESKDPTEFANFIRKLLSNNELVKNISVNNYFYAQEHFLSDKVIKRIEKIFTEVISSK